MDFFRRKFIERQYNLTQEDIAKMSTEEIKRRLGKLSPDLIEDIKKFSQYGVNNSQYVYDVYKTRASLALSNELLRRNSKNAKDVRNFKINSCVISFILALSILFTMGYMNRSEKSKATIDKSGVVTFSNGMTYNGFSSSDLEAIFGYSQNEVEQGILPDIIGKSFEGLENLLFSKATENATYKKAYDDALSLLKYSGALVLDGVRDTSFSMRNMTLEDWRKLDFCVNDIQDHCKIYMLSDVIEYEDESQASNFYKSVYYIVNGEKVYFNSKEEIMKHAGFSNEEDYDDFMINVICVLNGNVFYCSEPTAESEEGLVLSRTI